jgi:hypothetical protein
MRKLIVSLLVCLFSVSSFAAIVDTVSIFSTAMNRSRQCVVITPGTTKKVAVQYPTVYL